LLRVREIDCSIDTDVNSSSDSTVMDCSQVNEDDSEGADEVLNDMRE
jgi:hypothetical protein